MESPTSPLDQLAQQIANSAAKVAAERVTFHSEAGYEFAVPVAERILHVLSQPRSFKYKFQRRDDQGRWKDLSNYAFVRIGNEILTAVRGLDLVALRGASQGELSAAARHNQRQFRGAVRTVASAITLQPVRRDLVAWRDFFAAHGDDVDDPHLAYLRAQIDLLIIALDNGLVSPHGGDDNASALRALDEHADLFSSGERLVARDILRGKLWSLRDRTQAAAAFANAHQHDPEDLVRAFYIDMGALTYFLPQEVNSDLIRERMTAVRDSIVSLRTTPTENALAVVVSVDPNFYRIYAAQLFHFAQQVPEVDVVVLLCCEADQAAELIEAGDNYLQQLVALNRSGEPRNIQYYRSPVPAFVEDAKTFYASARFFATQLLLEQYQRLYTMDIDLVSEDDPMAYFRRIADIGFGTSTNHNIAALSPWRRNMAGNVAFSRAVLDGAVLSDLQAYLVHGLAQEAAWMLDQNALTYAIERNSDDYTPLDRFKRPFSQPRFRSTWEHRYFAEQKRRK